MNTMNSTRIAKLYRYQLPMDSGVVLRDNKLSQRTGYVIELEHDGKRALGEVSPLPGFSLGGYRSSGYSTSRAVGVMEPQQTFDAL